MMDRSKAGIEVVFDPITKSAILKHGNKVEILPGRFGSFNEAKRAAIEFVTKNGGQPEDVY